LIEAPIPKDKWIAPDAETISFPPIPGADVREGSEYLSGCDFQGTCVTNPEVRGGYVAFVASNNNRMQKPPQSLDRMHAALSMQISFNQRVLKNEEEVSGINHGMADFLMDMSLAEDNPLFVCVNVGERMSGTQPVCGQSWTHEDRQMTAINPPMPELDNSRESVALSWVVKALTWPHALERSGDPGYLRPGRRVIVYPKFLDKLESVLEAGDVTNDKSYQVAYQKILEQSCTWPISSRPIMLAENAPRIETNMQQNGWRMRNALRWLVTDKF
jgi:hypothetical protein